MLVEVGQQLRAELGEGLEQRTFGAVVGHEQHEGIVQLALAAQVVQHPADVPVHAFDHGGINLHGPRRDCPLLGAKALPFLAQLHQWMGLGRGIDQAKLAQFFQAFLAQYQGPCVIAAFVFSDDLGWRLQGPVRGGEGQVGKEWPALVTFLEVLQQLVAEGIGGIEILG
ncbi:hypothetical protein D3C76_1029070 [compost metagenome]